MNVFTTTNGWEIEAEELIGNPSIMQDSQSIEDASITQEEDSQQIEDSLQCGQLSPAEEAAALDIKTELGARTNRRSFLITYARADLAKFPSRNSFAEAVVEALSSTGNASPVQWACAMEDHADGTPHYHMSVKFDNERKWLSSKQYLKRKYGIVVNFAADVCRRECMSPRTGTSQSRTRAHFCLMAIRHWTKFDLRAPRSALALLRRLLPSGATAYQRRTRLLRRSRKPLD